jgi:hypothetical protein
MPGETRCLRCGAALVVPADFPVAPTRSKRAPTTRRASYKIGGFFSRLSFRTSQLLRRLGLEARGGSPEGSAGDFLYALVVSIIPGLGQWIQRRRIYAGLLFGSWVILLLLSMLSQWLLGLAISVQVTAIVDIYYGNRRAEVLVRVVFSLVLFFALWMFVYNPVFALVGRTLYREWIPAAMALQHVGDEDALIAFRAGHKAARGDLVEFRQHGTDFGMNVAAHAMLQVAEGTSVGRVVAVAGDTVSFSQGKLYVNGTPYDYAGDGPAIKRVWPVSLDGFHVTIAPGVAFVIPNLTAIGPAFDYAAGDVITRVCLVQLQDVLGRGVIVIRPLGRARLL